MVIFSEQELLKTVINHPVHIVDNKGNLSPSAFIPFCSFGDDFESMSTTIENFSLPVCNSFEAVIHKDQLCYQVDLEKFRKKKNFKEQLVNGLVLILDYNEDRNMYNSPSSTLNQGYISIDTISTNFRKMLNSLNVIVTLQPFSDDLILPVENREFEIKMFKEIQVTDSFLGINEDVRGCQEKEIYDDCIRHSHVDKIRNSCSCVPLSLQNNTNVKY